MDAIAGSKVEKVVSMGYLMNTVEREFRGSVEVGDFLISFDEKWDEKTDEGKVFNIDTDEFGYPDDEEIQNMIRPLVSMGLIEIEIREKGETESFVQIFKGNGGRKVLLPLVKKYFEENFGKIEEIEDSLKAS